ncbi:MAG: hypothetical protein CVU56_05505 [Deltaproteobacteria bacterium HGW-Deltaproteobacteria-14]|nr:MAG: hypothetical protein CVU56_05505 [Deltaproteobacteria bacterium HGW-Deltaproteobacteria-14]
MSPRVKRLIPWVLSLSIVGFLFLTTDIDAVGAALARADWPRLVGAMALVTLAAYLVDSFTLVALFRRFVGRVGVREVLRIKGVSYFLNAINYSLAMGGMAWILHKKRDIPFLETFSSLFWLFFVDIIALSSLITLGLALGPDAIGDSQAVARIPYIVLVIWGIIGGSLVYWNGGFDFFVLGRLRSWRVFDTFRRARLRDYPPMVAMRACFIMVYVLMHWAILPAFGVEIDLGHLLLYAPLIAFVQVIPATISGLGAVQGVMVALFTPHVPPGAGGSAAILAYSTVIGPLMMVMRLGIGYIFVASVAKDLVPTKEQVEAARQVAESE